MLKNVNYVQLYQQIVKFVQVQEQMIVLIVLMDISFNQIKIQIYIQMILLKNFKLQDNV